MDRTLLLRRLVEAERYLVEFEQIVTRQRHVIDTIARAGHDTAGASALLRGLRRIHATHLADRDQLLVDLLI